MSDFLKRKLRTFFTFFDYDKDGLISRADWIGLGARFAKFEEADKQGTKHLKTQFANCWDQYFKYSENKKQHTSDEFADAIAKQRYNPDFMICEIGLMRGLFDLMDVNCDGYLQEDEYQRLFEHMGVTDTSFVKDAFKEIDTNRDGKLSFQEFINAFFDFNFSEDENGGNTRFFGPLVD